MGVCCVKQHNQDKGEFREADKTEGTLTLYKNNKDAVEKIIKIQSAYRRYKAIRLLKQLRAQKEQQEKARPRHDIGPEGVNEVIPEATHGMAGGEGGVESSGQQNVQLDAVSDNTKVRELEAKLGPFRPDIKLNDSVRREYRDTVILDNGARYTGEW